MGRYINTISHTISTVFGSDAARRIVTKLATHGLRALSYARTLLVRLSGEASAQLQVVAVRHGQPGVAHAARTLEPTCSGATWQRMPRRLVKPGPGAKSVDCGSAEF